MKQKYHHPQRIRFYWNLQRDNKKMAHGAQLMPCDAILGNYVLVFPSALSMTIQRCAIFVGDGEGGCNFTGMWRSKQQNKSLHRPQSSTCLFSFGSINTSLSIVVSYLGKKEVIPPPGREVETDKDNNKGADTHTACR